MVVDSEAVGLEEEILQEEGEDEVLAVVGEEVVAMIVTRLITVPNLRHTIYASSMLEVGVVEMVMDAGAPRHICEKMQKLLMLN